jgi:VIT1/CCC1 family predicted Fe2+/Mn2+ transporter
MSGSATEPDAPARPRRSDAEVHHQHRDVTGGWLRPAVFGAMDGLVTNISLIAGVAGSGVATHTVLLTGFAGLLAGAFSMAVGEWTSVSSQNDLVAREVDLERLELANNARAEEAELAGMFRARGLSAGLSRQVAAELSQDPLTALRLHVREELGVDFEALASPWTAAGSSFVLFAIGALIPLLPYIAGATSLWWTLGVGGLALLVLGGLTARLTGHSIVKGAARQLLLGAVTVAVVYGVGRLIGAGTAAA